MTKYVEVDDPREAALLAKLNEAFRRVAELERAARAAVEILDEGGQAEDAANVLRAALPGARSRSDTCVGFMQESPSSREAAGRRPGRGGRPVD